MNVANFLTLMRIALVPVFVVVFYLPYEWSHWASALIFAVAGWTDWFDGYIARRYNMMSRLGAFLDPVADKLMVTTALVLLVERFGLPWVAIPSLVIIAREIIVSALREWMAEVGEGAAVKVSNIGKAKTMAQLSAIFFLLLGEPVWTDFWTWLGGISLYLAFGLTLWSMFIYLSAAWPHLTSDDKTP